MCPSMSILYTLPTDYVNMVTARLKVYVIGPRSAGKTTAIISYTKGEYPKQPAPPVYYSKPHPVISSKGIPLLLDLWDTALGCMGDGLGISSSCQPPYSQSDVFILCYQVCDPVRKRFNELKDYWFPVLNSYYPGVPVVLTATKIDLRVNTGSVLTREEGEKLAGEHNASYIEISSLRNLGLESLFVKVADVGYRYRVDQFKNRKKCSIL